MECRSGDELLRNLDSTIVEERRKRVLESESLVLCREYIIILV